MKRRLLLSLALAAAASLGDAQHRAAWAQDAELGDVNAALIARIETFFREIDTLRARFVQHNPDGSSYSGTFFLDRPGRMRLEYDPPVPYLYVSSGIWLTFWDSELEQRSDTLVGSTLADYFIREDVSLSGDVTVTDVRETGGLIELSIVQTDDPGAGQLIMVLSGAPSRLESWVIIDPQGNATAVNLTDQERGLALDRSLFRAPRPRWSQHR